MKKKAKYLLLICLSMAALVFVAWQASSASVVQPPLPRTGQNLIVNPNAKGSSPWELANYPGNGQIAQYDPNVSRTADGSGSFKISALGAQACSSFMQIVPGRTYSFAAYMKTSEWPVRGGSLFFQVLIRDPNDPTKTVWGRNDGVGGLYVNTTANEWQEATGFYKSINGDVSARVCFGRDNDSLIKDYPLGDIWVDDFYFGEGQGFEQPPSPKKVFDGAMTRIDELGNYEVLRNGEWKPFFPVGIYSDQARDLSFYSQQGFNYDVWCPHYQCVQNAKNAVSDFNPDGMMAGIEIAEYINYSNDPGGWGQIMYNNVGFLSDKIKEINDHGLMNNVLLYYWDNENQELEEYNVAKSVTDTIKKYDVDANGKRLHPISMLLDNAGGDRMYTNLVDTAENYILKYRGSISFPHDEISTMVNYPEKQILPFSMAVINYNYVKNDNGEITAPMMRMLVYRILIAGGKGLTYWADDMKGVITPRIETLGLWSALPQLRREIDQLLPIIRQPSWTDWKLTSSDNSIIFGTRDYQGQGYAMLVNPNDSAKTVTFTASGLSYAPSTAKDYFTGADVASISNSSFSVTLPADATRVYRLAPAVSPNLADLNADSLVNATDFNILKADFMKLTANLANPKSDIDRDGQVTIKDVGILMSGWK